MGRPKGSRNKELKLEKAVNPKPIADNKSTEPVKNKRGRPSTYKEEYAELVLDLMSKGQSLASCAAEIGVSQVVLFQWREIHPNFNSACEIGKVLAQQWCERLATGIATGAAASHAVYKRANYGMVQFMMSRRFPDYYAKNRALLEEESIVNTKKETVIFETQLTDGIIRQNISISEETYTKRIAELISEATSEHDIVPNER